MVSVRTDIKWAGRIESSAGGGIFAAFALGAPDCQSAGVFDGQSATFTDWRRASYEGLADLLGTVTPGGGDAVTEEMLASADIIAFEMNGNSPGFAGGWESAIWELIDSQGSVVVQWTDSLSAPRDAHIVANGSISGDRYGEFFGIPPELVTTAQPTLTPQQVVVSFQLLHIRGEIDVTGDAFRLKLSSPPGATPDPDAIGVLLHADQQPANPKKPVKSATRQVLDVGRLVGVEDAISPVMSAVWQRRATGLGSRNDFEALFYSAFDGLPADQQDALAHGFGRFDEFRALGTDRLVFSNRIADQIGARPPEMEEFAGEFMRAGIGVSAQALSPNSGTAPGPGQRRLWDIPGDESHPPVINAPTPHITALTQQRDGNPSAADPVTVTGSEFISSSSWIPPPGQPFEPQNYQYEQTCVLAEDQDGHFTQNCQRRVATASPGPPGEFPSFGALQCEGGADYSFGSSCLRLLAVAAGGSLVIRGFNFFTPTVDVHLRSHEHPELPEVVINNCLVYGDRETPKTGPDGKDIADARIRDLIEVPLPQEDPEHVGSPFPPGLYDVWVTVVDFPLTPPTPITRRSDNTMVVRIEPRADQVFSITGGTGRCEEETSGPGDDEIWWDAYVGHLVPPNEPTGEIAVRSIDHVVYDRGSWSSMSAHKDGGIGLSLFNGRFELGGIVCVGIVGLEVDDEDAAKEQMHGFGEGFTKALLAVTIGALAGAGSVNSFKDEIAKAGADIGSGTAVAIAGAIAAAAVFTGVCLWAAWAPADLIGLDVMVFDALTADKMTDPTVPLPGGTERSWRNPDEAEWIVVRERPQAKSGPSGSTRLTWNQENEYLSPDENSRYTLRFALQELQTPPTM